MSTLNFNKVLHFLLQSIDIFLFLHENMWVLKRSTLVFIRIAPLTYCYVDTSGEALLMITHNVGFFAEIRKTFNFQLEKKKILTGAVLDCF